MTSRCLTVWLLVVVISAPVFGQARLPADESAIRAQLTAYAAARLRRDAQAEAAYFADDGDFRGSDGRKATGRSQIAASLAVPPNPNYKFSLNIGKVRFLAESIAVVDATAYDGKMATYVMTKSSAGWLIAAARIALAPPTAK